MSESEIHADPERIRALADELRMFTNTLRTDVTSLDEAVGHLSNTWKDSEFDKFRNAYRKMGEKLKQLAAEINKNEPLLKADAEALAHYLKTENS